MKETLSMIVLTVIGSNAIFAFLQFMITRHDTKKNVKGKLLLLEKDVLRTQLLLLILLKPEEKQEILTVGEHYFKVLKGNWYMTSIFNKWLTGAKEAKPEWFDSKE
ncbi:MAG: hypothetical protein IKF42_03710 [Mogibacterium sp.]|nr:hypothetical protein [Mogibacterium sp.]